MINIEQIHNKKYKNIFLDIFDTIVYRTVQPEYTKKIWANHLVKRLQLDISITELYILRNQLETTLGEKAAKEGNDWEFTYDSLLDELYNQLNTSISIEEFKKIAIDEEVMVESEVQKPDKQLVKEIKKAKKQGQKVYCISDMYLSKQMLCTIFNNLEIKDLFDDIFVSCEYLKNKKSGSLYNIVLKKLKAKPEECIMIGDNQVSDYENPKEKGIDAIHLDRTKNYKKYEKFAQEHDLYKLEDKFSELLKTSTDNFEHTIFSLYQFIEKLYYSLINDNLDEVFFLSREGEYLKKLFDQFQSKVYGKKIKSQYILVSRKATYLPSLKELEKEDFKTLLQQYVYINLQEFLGSLNFSKNEITEILESYSADCKKIIKTKKLNDNEQREIQALVDKKYDQKIIYLYESKVLKYLKKNKKFKEIYETRRVSQKELFKKYIESYTDNKRICVVDVGWNGSIQDNIQNILGINYTVTGYLFGLITREDPEEIDRKHNKIGLGFTNVPTFSPSFELFAENRTVYEILLGASHGSADKYEEKNGKIIVKTFKKEEEESLYKNIISKLQEEMMVIFSQMLEILPNGYYDNHKVNKLINKAHFNMVFYPSEEQLKFFNKIYHYENFGVFEFTEFNLQKKMSLKYYLKENLKYFIKHRAFFYDAFWPILKLSNEKLHLQKALYRHHKKKQLKKKGVI